MNTITKNEIKDLLSEKLIGQVIDKYNYGWDIKNILFDTYNLDKNVFSLIKASNTCYYLNYMENYGIIYINVKRKQGQYDYNNHNYPFIYKEFNVEFCYNGTDLESAISKAKAMYNKDKELDEQDLNVCKQMVKYLENDLHIPQDKIPYLLSLANKNKYRSCLYE